MHLSAGINDSTYGKIVVQRGNEIRNILAAIHLMEPGAGSKGRSSVCKIRTQNTRDHAFLKGFIKGFEAVCEDSIGGIGKYAVCLSLFQFIGNCL